MKLMAKLRARVNNLRAFGDIDPTTLVADYEQVSINCSGLPRNLSSAEDATRSELFGQRGESWWTGKPLQQEVPGMRPDGRLPSLPQLVLKNCTREVRRLYFVYMHGSRKLYADASDTFGRIYY